MKQFGTGLTKATLKAEGQPPNRCYCRRGAPCQARHTISYYILDGDFIFPVKQKADSLDGRK